jgi:hypothetical protein
MRCARCAGLIVPEILYEGGTRVVALRCIHCGDVIDPVIVRNRRRIGQSPLRLWSVERWRDASRYHGPAIRTAYDEGHLQSVGEEGREA